MAPYRLAARLVVFLLLLAACLQVFRPLGYAYPKVYLPHRDGDTFYLGYDDYNYDHAYFLFNEKGVTQAPKKASLLFVGSSRVLLGIRFENVMGHLAGTGVRPFWLAFGQNEPYHFMKMLIERDDLRPKLVVLNADSTLFRPTASGLVQAMQKSGRESVLAQAAERLRVNGHLRMFWELVPVPRYVDGKLRSTNVPYLYRSMEYGDWVVAAPKFYEHKRESVGNGWAPIPADYGAQLERARGFVKELQERGAEVVLTVVPCPGMGNPPAQKLGQDLGVSVLTMDWTDLVTFDSSHLDPPSATKYTEFLMTELPKTPEWKRAFPLAGGTP